MDRLKWNEGVLAAAQNTGEPHLTSIRELSSSRVPHTNQTNSPPLGKHLPVLDGIRGLAILLVMLHHQTVIDPQSTGEKVFVRIFESGWIGVDLFFVLSGFLITGILYDSVETKRYFRNFYGRRILRIFPLYYLIVFFSLVVLPHFDHPKAANFGRIGGSELWYWLFLSNFSIAWHQSFRHAILDISWSLAIEEQFYLLWPLLVLWLSRLALMRLSVLLVVLSLAVRVAMAIADVGPLAIYVSTYCRLDGLATGAFIALLMRGETSRGSLRRITVAIGVPTGLIVVLLCCWKNNNQWLGFGMHTFGFSLLALAFGSLLMRTLLAPPGSFLCLLFSNRLLQSMGKYSYALYLFHVPIRAVFRDALFRPQLRFGSQIPEQLLFYCIASAVSLFVAWICWHVYEKQFQKMRRFFV
jgi:peptidoglycan/LPS O-acetylase OafA/YrhL